MQGLYLFFNSSTKKGCSGLLAPSDIRPITRDQLQLLQEEIINRLDAGVNDHMTRIHLEDALGRIETDLR